KRLITFQLQNTQSLKFYQIMYNKTNKLMIFFCQWKRQSFAMFSLPCYLEKTLTHVKPFVNNHYSVDKLVLLLLSRPTTVRLVISYQYELDPYIQTYLARL